MTDHRATSPISVPNQRRPSLASMPMSLGSQNGPGTGPTNTTTASSAPGNHPRRLSITTLGLAGSPTQSFSFVSAGANGSAHPNGNGNGTANGGPRHLRGGSLSSSAGSTTDDTIITEESGSAPPSALARRMSFGAQALRDVRRGSVNTDERSNWSESLRTRAGRAPSISNILSGSPTSPPSHGAGPGSRQLEQHRAASIAHMEMEPPVREIPKQPRQANKPDFFQEKILRGDFMD